jgi:hypothetical protein
MASLRREILIDARPDDAWAALRAWSTPHEDLVPGFVVDTRMDGDDRIVTFFNGAVAREVLVDLDEGARRLVWSVVDGPFTHHNGAAQVFAEGERTRFVWIADLLPDEAAALSGELMDRAVAVIKQTLESGAERLSDRWRVSPPAGSPSA